MSFGHAAFDGLHHSGDNRAMPRRSRKQLRHEALALVFAGISLLAMTCAVFDFVFWLLGFAPLTPLPYFLAVAMAGAFGESLFTDKPITDMRRNLR